MQTISFYSYKGGVGRSLALTNLAVYLVQFGATVVMIDLDLEAPGLPYKLQAGEPVDVHGRGIAGVLADVSDGTPPSSVDYRIVQDVSHLAIPEVSEEESDPQGQLLLVPAGNPLSPNYWRDLAAIQWERLFMGEARPGVTALARFKQYLRDSFDPDVLLVDSRTGITPGGGVATTLLPDVVVTLLLNSREHLDGASAVVEAVTSSPGRSRPPRVVPVLSRYTSPPPRRVLRSRRTTWEAVEELDESSPRADLDAIHAALVKNLSPAATALVSEPQVLHADLALQRKESLAFGRFASAIEPESQTALLDDYVRLFAKLVDTETIIKYTDGARRRARAMVLDRPEDAERTLESLLSLVGDPLVFVDLLKIYALRRDSNSVLATADRMFRVHGSVIPYPDLSTAARDASLKTRPAPSRTRQASASFLEAYWRAVAPDDVEWGAGIALQYTWVGMTADARRLANQIADSSPDERSLTTLVRTIALGNAQAEALAVEVAISRFAMASDSTAFLTAAAAAAGYRKSRQLATLILDADGAAALPSSTTIDLMRLAGRRTEAGELLVEVLSSIRPGEEADEFHASWRDLIVRNRGWRQELNTRNPDIVNYLEAKRGDDDDS